MLSQDEVKESRKLELIYTNILIFVSGLVLYLLFTSNLGLFWLTLGFIFLIDTIISIRINLPYALFSFLPLMRKLKEHEKEKLGQEAKKVYRLSIITQIIVIPVFIFFAYLNWGKTISINPLVVIVMLAAVLIFANITLLVNRKKIDQGSSEQLRSYTEVQLLVGLAGSLIFVGVIFIFAVLTL